MRTVQELRLAQERLESLGKEVYHPVLSQSYVRDSLEYVAWMVGEVASNGGYVGHRPLLLEQVCSTSYDSSAQKEFTITQSQIDSVPTANFPISFQSFAAVIWEYAQKPKQLSLRTTYMIQWLVKHRYIQEDLEGKSKYAPTDRGLRHGFCVQERVSQKGESFYTLALEQEGQQLILEKLPRMLRLEKHQALVTKGKAVIPVYRIHQAKHLLQQLQQAINPVSYEPVVDASYLQENKMTFVIAEEVLLQLIDNKGYFTAKPRPIEEIIDKEIGAKFPFSITLAEAQALPIINRGISIQHMVNVINEYRHSPYTSKIESRDITPWLVEEGYLFSSGKYKLATPRGEEIGLEKSSDVPNRQYTVYTAKAQSFVYGHLPEIIAREPLHK